MKFNRIFFMFILVVLLFTFGLLIQARVTAVSDGCICATPEPTRVVLPGLEPTIDLQLYWDLNVE